jgi:hypothetical protein
MDSAFFSILIGLAYAFEHLRHETLVVMDGGR